MGSKRETAVSLINNGEWTREKLMKKLDVTKRGLDSLFCYLRMSYRYPYSDPETGILEILTQEEHDARKEIDRQKKAVDRFHTSRKYRSSHLAVGIARDEVEVMKAAHFDDEVLKGMLVEKAEIELQIAQHEQVVLINDFYRENAINLNELIEQTL